jgi:hypothetical protein
MTLLIDSDVSEGVIRLAIRLMNPNLWAYSRPFHSLPIGSGVIGWGAVAIILSIRRKSNTYVPGSTIQVELEIMANMERGYIEWLRAGY